jgi:hypothetical protein
MRSIAVERERVRDLTLMLRKALEIIFTTFYLEWTRNRTAGSEGEGLGRHWTTSAIYDSHTRNENTMTGSEGLPKRIGETARAKKRTPASRNRAAFLAVREEIRSALDHGWAIKAVWTTLRKEGAIQ